MKYIQNITLDVSENLEYKYINAKQGDNATRYLNITLTENNEKIIPESGYVASFRYLKPDGHSSIDTGVINKDGTITVELTNQVLAVEGTTQADISLSNGSSVLSAASFYIQVGSAPISPNQAASNNDFLLLIQKTTEAIEAITAIDETVNNAKEALAGVEDIKAYIGYTDNDILGLCVDYENKVFTRLAGAVGRNAGTDFDSFAMYGGRKRCNVADDGTINAYYGDANYTKDGTNGQVMVYQPKFYYKVVPLKLEKNTATGLGYHIRKANYYVSDTPKAGFKLHPAFNDKNGNEVDYILYSAYEGVLKRTSDTGYYSDALSTSTSLDTEADLICSVDGQKPISGLNIALDIDIAEKLCSNRGQGWHNETIKTLSANQLLMMIEFGTMNVQSVIGRGIVDVENVEGRNCCGYTGSTSSLGNKTGTASSTTVRYASDVPAVSYTVDGKKSVTYRGTENPWGNIFKFVSGINIYGNGNMEGGQPYIADDFNYAENKHDDNYRSVGFTVPATIGYVSAMGYGSEEYDWLIMPSEVGGNSNLPVGDSFRPVTSNLNGYRIVIFGGAWYYGVQAGAFYYNTYNSATSRLNVIGCRLVYIPTAD